jgi:signal transduction histidine kinase
MDAIEQDMRLLVVDDDAVDRDHLRRLLVRAEIDAVVVEEADPDRALAYLRGASVHVILLDDRFPLHDGMAVLREIRASDDVTPIIVLTGQDDVALAVELMKAGAVDCVAKSALTPPGLGQSIARALRVRASELARRAAETALRESEERSRRVLADQKQQSDFEQHLLGIVSHDLRNPIAAMVMAAMLLKERLREDPVSANVAQRIIQSGERATRLIRDLLDVTQARLGRGIPVDPTSADLHQVCKQAVDEVALAHPARSVRHEAIGEGGGIWDSDRLVQAIGNLIQNAISYSPPDSFVTVRSQGCGPSVVVEVYNEGEPIDPEALQSLFQPFKRTAGKLHPERSVGLGLFIVREIVAAHRGSLSVESTHAVGTTFRFELPRS